MSEGVPEAKLRRVDSEKITINLGFIDLGKLDLLVQEGFYSNRTDLIRTAIRNQLELHRVPIMQSVTRRQLELGLRRFSSADLESVRGTGEMLHVQVLGLAIIESDVSPQLARDTIASIQVLGALQASAAVKAALGDRIIRLS